jgi:putative ABC transport system permease protein
VIASLAAGLAPALFAASADLQTFLRDGGRTSSDSRRRTRTRGALAAGEVALAMVLLTAAGLLMRSFAQLVSVDPGFDHERLVKAAVSLPRFQYPEPRQWTAFGDQLLAGLHMDPALKDSALAVPIPLADGSVNLGFQIADRPPAPGSAPRTADYASVSPDYFRVMGMRLLVGRMFDERDILKSPRVTVISQALARRYFPGEDPIGKRLVFSFPPDPGVLREIIGVVSDVRDKSLGQDPDAMMYVPFAQGPFWGAGVVVRSGLTPAGVAAAIRREVTKIDPDLPVTNVASMPDILQASVAQPRFTALLLGIFGAMALVLAATGIFGVVSYSVARRTNEIGVRLALGASRGSILRLVLGETLWLAVIGLIVGVPCALAASLAVRRLLFGVPAGDPVTVVAVAITLAAVAALAGYVPARRAMRVDPIVSLRAE